MPAKAGIQGPQVAYGPDWMPAYAGVTTMLVHRKPVRFSCARYSSALTIRSP